MSAGYTRVRRLLGWPEWRQVALSGLIGLLLAFYAWRFLLPLLGPQAPRADDFQDYLFAAQQIATGGILYAVCAVRRCVQNHVNNVANLNRDVVSGNMIVQFSRRTLMSRDASDGARLVLG